METGAEIDKVALALDNNSPVHPMWKCMLPLIVPIIVMNVFKQAPETALVCALIATYLIFLPSYSNIKESLNGGISNAIAPLINVCGAVAFGTACAAVPGFEIMKNSLLNLPVSPLVQLCLAVFVASGVTGAASGGMGIAFETLGKRFMEMGVDPQLAHRLGAMSSFGGVGPNCGAVINTLTMTRLKHSQGYVHYFVLDIVIMFIALLVGFALAQTGIR